MQGLDWLSAEVEASLAAASEALDAYQTSHDEGLLARCLDNFHQVLGCLKITEFDSGALLLAEMEQVVLALRDRHIGNIGDACDVLVQATGAILTHLARWKAGAPDHTGPLVPILNDLRAVRGEQLFSEVAPFTPHLEALDHGQVSSPVLDDAARSEFPKQVKKLRQHFQAALLGLLKDGAQPDHLRNLDKVIGRLIETCGETEHGKGWAVAAGFVEGLSRQSIPWSCTARWLLRELERELRCYVDLGAKALDGPFPRGLLVNLLYYIAIAGGDSPRILALQETFRLREALPGDGQDKDSVLEPAVVEAVAGALHQELEAVKDRVEEFIANGDGGALDQAVTLLQRMADTLAMANQLDLQQCCQSVVQFISELDASSAPQLDTLAASIVDIEAGIAAWRAGAPEDVEGGDTPARALAVSGALVQLLEEAGQELQVIKQAVLAHLKGEGEVSEQKSPLSLAASAARNLATVLRLAAMERCAAIIETFASTLEDESAATVEDWRGLDALADTLTAVEYYLDNRKSGRLSDDDALLGLAELALARLTRTPVEAGGSLAPALTDQQPPVGEDEDDDPEIRDIFVEEAREVLATLRERFPVWAGDTANNEALTDTRRAFHTLKGSGRMVGATAIGEFAWAMENLLNRVLEGRVAATQVLLGCVEDAIALLPGMVSAFEARRPVGEGERVAILTEMAERLASGETLDTAVLADLVAAPTVATSAGHDDEDRQLLEIFTREASTHLAVVRQFIALQRGKKPFCDHPSAQVQSALHTLKGSAHMAAIEPLAELITPLERFMRDMLNFQIAVDEDILDLLADSVDFSEQMVARLNAGEGVEAQGVELAGLQARISELRERALGSDRDGASRPPLDPAFLQLLMADGMQHVLDIEHALAQWQNDNAFDRSAFATVASELGELRNSAEKAGYAPLALLAEQLAATYAHLGEKRITATDDLVETLAGAHETLLNMIDAVAAHQEIVAASDAELEALSAIAQRLSDDDALRAELARRVAGITLSEDRDNEIIELFLVEADELLESLEQAFHQWRQSPGEHGHAESLKRSLHTFKGGARMAGISALGEISHELESVVIAREAEVTAGDVSPIATMLCYHDALSAGVEMVRKGLRTVPARAVAAPPPEPVSPSPSTEHAEASAVSDRPSAEILPFVGTSRGLGVAEATSAQQAEAAQEMVRVSASALDMLVNLAGETSISRSQVEQHISEFMFSLEEMDATIRRMHDQVRRLGIETDAQVMFRREQIESSEGTEGFDPLEMDRYSQLQQLSRSLLESASDLHDLRDTLVNKARDAEALLLQQSRINTDLQEGLMRTRMVPFSRTVPRLRRIVRQVGSNLGKQVSLQLERVDGEMDRTILERIVPSLEHMIRNAVDHGIESAEERRSLGKPETGTLTISLDREGADILIRLRDDGRGLDVDAIRAKAVASGLMAENSLLSDRDIQQFIFTPGFTTSSEVTQVSGRGVGMDVVNSDVRQLGGSISIESQRGIGTEFTVRLPFTVSVNRALMIEAGEDTYALPLNSISGVSRIAVDELQRFYENPQLRFQYGGEDYEVRYLGSLLSTELRPTLDTALGHHLPVVLVRNEGRRYAVQVDGLIGSREVVVKTLGTQFSRVPGLSGATVLGDGRVVVILDLQALLRDQLTLVVPTPVVQVQEEEDDVPTVMVVDDSVTVRKVTGRFLEREGYRVITAKDGVDAMRVLQDHTPDVMLLDIEMPRMDGFEVARLVRSTQRLKNLPIVMITSRTGDKHRDRALAMGVNHYLGKPYQEDVLLDVVRELLDGGRLPVKAGEAG